MTTVREGGAIAKKQLAIRELHWPGVDIHLWNRKANKGFATIPKTMPLILKAMDEITKGAPVSSTYLALWCSTWDNSFVVLNKHGDLANASGFGGQRGEHTWQARMKKLQELQFIDIKPGKSGPMSNAIIWNPHYALRRLHEMKTPGLTEATYNSLVEWALDIGAKDMTDPWEQIVAAQMPPTATAARDAAACYARDPCPGCRVGFMRTIEVTGRFKRDYKRELRTDPDLGEKFNAVVQLLAADETLPESLADHGLSGKWKGFRDCHVKPDLVLIYARTDEILSLARLGSHSELF